MGEAGTYSHWLRLFIVFGCIALFRVLWPVLRFWMKQIPILRTWPFMLIFCILFMAILFGTGQAIINMVSP